MSMHRTLALLAIPLLGAALSLPAAAIPLPYDVVPSESDFRLGTALDTTLNASPDLTDGSINGQTGQLPFTAHQENFSNTRPSPNSTAVADVGRPDFNDGANGIDFSQLEIDFFNLPGPVSNVTVSTTLGGLGIQPGGSIPGLPVGIGETPVLLLPFSVRLTTFNITLNEPFSSPLVADPLNEGQYFWAGAANVTVSGVFQPDTPGPFSVGDPPDPIPFEAPLAAFPLAGTFIDHGNGGSEIVVGLDTGAENQVIGPDPVDLQVEVPVEALDLEEILDGLVTELQLEAILELLGDSILVDLDLELDAMLDPNLAEVHYVNSTPIPEPGTAALLGMGVAILAVTRRLRRT